METRKEIARNFIDFQERALEYNMCYNTTCVITQRSINIFI